MAKLQDYLEQVNVFSALKEEPEWMLELRQAALAKVDELAFPKNRAGALRALAIVQYRRTSTCW